MTYLASLTEETNDKLNGYYIIKTKEELEQVIADNSTASKIVIRSSFAKEYFTPSGIADFVRNARAVNRNLVIELDKETNVVETDEIVRRLAKINNFDELIAFICKYPVESLNTIQNLATKRDENQRELLAASSTVSRLQAVIAKQRAENEDLQFNFNREQIARDEASSKLELLVNRINYQYNKNVDPDKMFKVTDSKYDKIIYIKEITRVQYTDTFVYYLREILKVLYGMPTRLAVIEKYYATGVPKLYPDLKPHYSLSENDILTGDILMLGLQPKVMEDILRNPNGVSILIVLDRAGYEYPHIMSKEVEYFYTVSDLKDKPKNVPGSRIISYSDKTLYIPLIKGFEELDKSGQMKAYSSMSIVKKIIDLIEGR